MHSRAASTDIQGTDAGAATNRILVASPNSNDRWRLNGAGQPDTQSDWDLADQFVKMKLNGAPS